MVATRAVDARGGPSRRANGAFQALFLAFSDGAMKGAGVLVALMLARFYGPDVYGTYAAFAALAGLSLIPTALGFEQELTRRGGLDPGRLGRDLSLTLWCLGASVVAAFLVFAASAFATGTGGSSLPLGLAIALTAIAGRLHLPFRHLCLARGESQVTASVHAASVAVLVAGMGTGILYGVSLAWQIGWQLLVALGTLVVWLVVARRAGVHYTGTSSRERWTFARASLPFATTNILWIAYFNFDAYWLSIWRPESEVGLYAGVYRLAGLTYILGYAFSNSHSPRLFHAWQHDRVRFARTARSMAWRSAALGCLLSAALFVLAEPLTVFVLGDEYLPAVGAARLLALSVAFRFANFSLAEILTTSDRQRTRILWESALLAINVAGNMLLVPRIGFVGAAVATLVAEAVIFAGLLVSIPGFLSRSVDEDLSGRAVSDGERRELVHPTCSTGDSERGARA